MSLSDIMWQPLMLLEIEKDNLLYGRANNFLLSSRKEHNNVHATCSIRFTETKRNYRLAQSDLLRRREITDIKRKDLSFIANIWRKELMGGWTMFRSSSQRKLFVRSYFVHNMWLGIPCQIWYGVNQNNCCKHDSHDSSVYFYSSLGWMDLRKCLKSVSQL